MATKDNAIHLAAYLIDDLSREKAHSSFARDGRNQRTELAIAFDGGLIQFFVSRIRFMLESTEAPNHRYASLLPSKIVKGTYMQDKEIYDRLNKIFGDVLGNDSITLTAATTAEDVPEWDSMNNIFLMVGIEQSFGIKFHTAEMERLVNVGNLVQLISNKIGKAA